MGRDALVAARKVADGLEPLATAARCGMEYRGDADQGEFVIPFLGGQAQIAFPTLEVVPAGSLPDHVAALLVYYLGTCDGTEPTDRWVSFADLPGGEFYVHAFRGYTGTAIARRFGTDRAALEGAVAALGGVALSGLADVAWRIPALPHVPVALLFWDADDEFEARAELLFDETALCHLPLDGCAVLGSWLTGTLGRLAG